MKNFTKIGLASLAVLGLGFFAVNQMNAAETTTDEALLKLTIQSGNLTIGVGTATGDLDDLDLGTVVASLEDQEKSGTFGAGKEFWVNDLLGSASGYYTTIEATALESSTVTNKIPKTNVYFGYTKSDLFMTGTVNAAVKMSSELTTSPSKAIGSPVRYIYRENGNDGANKLGKYGDLPTVKVVIPGGTPAAVYTGKIVYTLYDAYSA